MESSHRSRSVKIEYLVSYFIIWLKICLQLARAPFMSFAPRESLLPALAGEVINLVSSLMTDELFIYMKCDYICRREFIESSGTFDRLEGIAFLSYGFVDTDVVVKRKPN